MDLNFNVGDAIELTIEEKRYKTVVEKQIDKEVLMIYSPISKGQVLAVREGQYLDVAFSALEQDQDKYDVYSYRALVIGREIVGNVPMLTLQAISAPKKVQRRDFFRLNISKTLLIENIKNESTIEVVTQDISAGGMQAISPKKLIKDEEYLVYMNIFEDFPIVLSAKVLSSELADMEYNRYVNRFYFTNMDKKLQADMVKQINNLQIIEIRKRKLTSPMYVDELNSFLDEELLERYNLDNKVDRQIRYLSFFNILIALIMIVVLVMAMPNTEWAPLFGTRPKKNWNMSFLKLDIFISTLLFLSSSFGLIFDRMHYTNRRPANMFFVIVLLFSLFFLLGLVIFSI